MIDPNKKKDPEECDTQSLDCAEKKLHTSIAKDNPEWVDENGECPSCTSLEHELADPLNIPEIPKKDTGRSSKA